MEDETNESTFLLGETEEYGEDWIGEPFAWGETNCL